MTARPERCETCAHWARSASALSSAIRSPSGGDRDQGACQIGPPVLFEIQGFPTGVWPVTGWNRYCEEWSPISYPDDPDQGDEADDRTVVELRPRRKASLPSTLQPAAHLKSVTDRGYLAGDSGGVPSPALHAREEARVNVGRDRCGYCAGECSEPRNFPARQSAALESAHGRG